VSLAGQKDGDAACAVYTLSVICDMGMPLQAVLHVGRLLCLMQQ
jgi:hypothetical protein